MASQLSGESSHDGASEGSHKVSHGNPDDGGGRWYFSRKEIEENSPSRQDGVDLRKEGYFRKSYCTFLQDLGIKLRVPQVTIATAIIFCHRFFLRQSHAKNDRRRIAAVCMFLAGKVEETPRALKDVILVSYEIMHSNDPDAKEKIKKKDVYEHEKELILLGERIVLVTLGFDLNVLHPYKPLVDAIKKFKVAQNALAQVAWNFVNDGLRTSLCLQFKPHHIAAGAIFLAAKFLKVKLSNEVWGQEFHVTSRQLEEVSNQMLELYEQNGAAHLSHVSEAEGSAGNCEPSYSKGLSNSEHVAVPSQGVTATKASSSSKPEPSRADSSLSELPTLRAHNNYHGNCDGNSVPANQEANETRGIKLEEHEPITCQGNSLAEGGKSRFAADGHQEGDAGRSDGNDAVEVKDKHNSRSSSSKVGQSPYMANKKLDPEKVISLKAAIERRKAQGNITRKADPEDEIEMELENVEMPDQREKSKSDRKQNWSKSSSQRAENENSHHVTKDGSSPDAVEEGELELIDDLDRGYRSPRSSGSRKRKPESHHTTYSGERSVLGRHEYQERENKRRLQENHV